MQRGRISLQTLPQQTLRLQLQTDSLGKRSDSTGFNWSSNAMLFLLTLPVTIQAQFSFVTNNGVLTIIGYSGSATTFLTPRLGSV